MDVAEVQRLLVEAGLEVKRKERLGNDLGSQLRLNNGAIVNVYDNGTCNVQGKNKTAVEAALGKLALRVAEQAANDAPKHKVFVVYGHDEVSRTQLEAMLRRWGLEPLIIDQLPTEG